MAAGTLNFTRSSVQSPALDFAKELRSFGSDLVSSAKAEEALKYQRDREAIQDARVAEEYNRTLLDRKASDAANAELAKGRQIYGGVLNTDAIMAKADQNSFTPEELTKYDMYKDSKTARAAGDTALADKMDWQTNLSNVADTLPGNNAVKESRVQMYEGIMDRLNKQGLPIPPSVIASMDQARLFEETENATKLKENTEAQSKNAADQILNAKYAVSNAYGSSGGTQPVTNENGEVVGYTSAAAQKRDLGIDDKYDAAMGKGQTDITKELRIKFKDTEDAPAKIAAALDKYKTILKADPTIDPEAASAAILLGAGVESSWFPSWIVKDKATYSDSTPDALISKLRNTRTPNTLVGNTAGGSTAEGSKASAASDLASRISLQQAGTAQQLKDERAKILKGEDGRREDRVNDILMNAGLLDKPKVVEQPSGTKPGSDGVRADRNNNPGNITGDDDWEGKSGKDDRFVQFKTYADGSRALAKNLKNAAVGQTVQEYMSKYAPKSDNNDTEAYIKNVSDKLGIKPGDKITDEHVWPLMQAIATQEGGKVDIEGLKAGYDRVYPTAIKTKADEILEKTEEGKTVGESKVVDLFNKSDLTKDGINKEDILNRNSSAPLIDVKAEEDLKNINWYNPIEKAKVRSSLINRGYSGDDADNMISTILKEKAEKTRSDNLIADRNYRAAKRTGSKVSGKTAEEWNELRSTKNRIGDYGFVAPFAAAAAPIAATIGTLYGGATAVSGIGGTALAGTAGREIAVKALRKKSVDITKDVSRSKQELEKIRETILNSNKKPSEDLIKKQDDLAEYIARANKEIEDIRKIKDYALNTKTKPGDADKALDELLRRYDINARPTN